METKKEEKKGSTLELTHEQRQSARLFLAISSFLGMIFSVALLAENTLSTNYITLETGKLAMLATATGLVFIASFTQLLKHKNKN